MPSRDGALRARVPSLPELLAGVPVLRDPEVLEGYLHDASNLPGHAEGLVRPRSAVEVAGVLATCQALSLPVTVTARRTSTTGGPVPRGGLLLSMEHLTRVLRVDRDEAEAEGGVLLGHLQELVEARGRFFPPDPTSRHECSLGAAIACNASGARSFRYGPMRHWVTRVEVVLADGTVVQADRDTPVPAGWPVPKWVEPAVKSAAGYAPAHNLLDLLIGSEGTLGVVTRATVRLTDLPEHVFGVFAGFPHVHQALACVRALKAGARGPGPIRPRCIEFYDHRSLELARERHPELPASAQCALWCEQDCAQADADASLGAWLDLLVAHGALEEATLASDDPAGRARMAAWRHAVPAGVNERVVRNRMPKVGTDCAVPDRALEAVMAWYADPPVPGVLFGHIGDAHLHLNLLPEDAEGLVRARAWYVELCRRVVDLGGTVSAEHGIGKAKVALLAEMVGPEVLASFRALKAAADPAWVLGRGNLLAPPNEEVRP